jgi:hypothetical protein
MQRLFFFLVFFLLSVTTVQAQQQPGWVTVSGRVLQAGKETPMAQVSVVARPSRSGTTTAANGTFTLKAHPGDTVTFSSVGFQNGTYFVLKSALQANIRIVLAEKSTELSEVEVSTRPSAEKIARALRNQKRPPEPDPIKAPPPGKPLFKEKPAVAVQPSAYHNPATFLYDKYSREGKEKEKMANILKVKAQAIQDSITQQKEAAYDQLFLDRNEYFKNPYYRRW